MVNIELPKDAEGREIPLDTALLYGKVSGEEYEVVCFNFRPSMRQWRVELKMRDDLGIYATENFTLSPPDSWEKLEDDLDRCIEADCISHGTSLALVGIKQRIRKLRGEY